MMYWLRVFFKSLKYKALSTLVRYKLKKSGGSQQKSSRINNNST